jgi:hypothetical protein
MTSFLLEVRTLNFLSGSNASLEDNTTLVMVLEYFEHDLSGLLSCDIYFAVPHVKWYVSWVLFGISRLPALVA